MKLLSVEQYADEHGVSPQSVYQRIKRGTLKTVTIKKEVIRIPVEDVESVKAE